MESKPYEMTSSDYLHLCDECRKDPDNTESDINQSCDQFNDCLSRKAQEKLVQYLYANHLLEHRVSNFLTMACENKCLSCQLINDIIDDNK
jgi:transcriptional regulator CtsR